MCSVPSKGKSFHSVPYLHFPLLLACDELLMTSNTSTTCTTSSTHTSSTRRNSDDEDDDESKDVVFLKNQRILLKRRPNGLPKRDDFLLDTETLAVPSAYFQPHLQTQTQLQAQTATTTTTSSSTLLLLETLHVSRDPAMRGWMSSAKSYLPPVKLNSVMRALTICRILGCSKSSSPSSSPSLSSSSSSSSGNNNNNNNNKWNEEFPINAIVKTEIVGVQSYCLLEFKTLQQARKLLTRLDDQLYPQQPTLATSSSSSSSSSSSTATTSATTRTTTTTTTTIPTNNSSLSYASFLGVLGTTGLTAYFGLLEVGKPKKNDAILVSGAAGATGSIVAQIAKHVVGCKLVIGTAGTNEKCKWLEQNNIVDIAINYKTKKTTTALAKAIAKACFRRTGGGVDLVFDNVGGPFLEAALSNLSMGAKIVLCGAISQYNLSSNSRNSTSSNNNNNNNSNTPTGPRNYMNLLVKRASMKGFVVLDYKTEFPTAIRNLIQWIQNGKLKHYKEDTTHKGIANFYPALLSLFEGTNIGKVVLQVEETSHETKRSRL